VFLPAARSQRDLCGSPRRHPLFWMGTREDRKRKALAPLFSLRSLGVAREKLHFHLRIKNVSQTISPPEQIYPRTPSGDESCCADRCTSYIQVAENETASHRHAQIIDEANTKMGNCKLALAGWLLETPPCLCPVKYAFMFRACTTSTFYINMSHCCIRR
jgi:hypothetical protein